MEQVDTVPLIVLGGSDRRAGALPEGAGGRTVLVGYKGTAVRIGGQPLIEHLLDEVRACGRFGPLYVAGPAEAYRELRGVELIETDRSFGRNIRAGLEAVAARHPGSQVAFLTCDVLPGAAALRKLLDDWRHGPSCDLFFPIVRAPVSDDKLGASAWKPRYRIVPSEGQAGVSVLPGHLVIARPEALRLPFLYHLLELGYRSRNRSIAYRRIYMVAGTLGILIAQDVRHALRLRMPNFAWSVLSAGLMAATKLRAGTLTRAELEDALRRLFVTWRWRRDHPESRVRTPLVESLGLALDIDTVEEARQHGGRIGTPA